MLKASISAVVQSLSRALGLGLTTVNAESKMQKFPFPLNTSVVAVLDPLCKIARQVTSVNKATVDSAEELARDQITGAPRSFHLKVLTDAV